MYNLQVMLCKSGDTLFSPYCKEREEIAHGTNTKSACHVGLICHAVNRFPPHCVSPSWVETIGCREPGGVPFSFRSCAMPHWTATRNLINHSAVIQRRRQWNCPACYFEHQAENYLQWVSSAKKHPGMDLLPGRPLVMPLFFNLNSASA